MLDDVTEFDDLVKQATALLAHAERAEPRHLVAGNRVALRLWDYPAFGERRTWTVFESAAAGELPIVRQVTWYRRVDIAVQNDAVAQLHWHFDREPTIEVEDGTLPPALLRQQLIALSRLRLPAQTVEELVGLDSAGATVPAVDPQWWCERPDEWRELGEWFARTREMLVDALCPV